MKFLIINGPNLNMLGIREPEIYGTKTYRELTDYIKDVGDFMDVKTECFQSNHEGAIIDKIQDAYGKINGIIINPGAYSHTSIAIPDALRSVGIPAAEVHLTNLAAREEYRQHSYCTDACVKTFQGLGFKGYRDALLYLKEYVHDKRK